MKRKVPQAASPPLPILALGTECMRRASVKQVQRSGLEHLRGVVILQKQSRVTILWTDGQEEIVSLRRAQTMADAFRRLPSTHEFRRRRKDTPKPKAKPKNHSTSERKISTPPTPPISHKAIKDDTLAKKEEQNENIEPCPPPCDESITAYSKDALTQLRGRKASPGMKIEWHGGKGFGTSQSTWVNVGEGHFRRRASLVTRDTNSTTTTD